jgi:DNA mismatch repair ATPase MutL
MTGLKSSSLSGWIDRKNIPLRHRPLLRATLESAGKWSELSAERQACLVDETAGRRSGGTRNKRGAAIKDEPAHTSENEESKNENENEAKEQVEEKEEQENEDENKNENEETEKEKENENEKESEDKEEEKQESKQVRTTRKVAKRRLRDMAVSAQKKETSPVVVVEEPPASAAVVLSDNEDDGLRRVEELRWTCDEDEQVDDANQDLRLEAQGGPQPAVPEPAPELALEPAGAASEQKEDEATTIATAPALQATEAASGDTVPPTHAEASAMEVDPQPQTTPV